MNKADWIWMPHAGHFICGSKCLFHLNTCVGDYIVSTLGEYWPDSAVRKINAEARGKVIPGFGDDYDRNYLAILGYEELGFGRIYETMVFVSVNAPDAEGCCPFRAADGTNLDFEGYNDPIAAFQGHLKLCEKWSQIHHEGPKPKYKSQSDLFSDLRELLLVDKEKP